MSRYRLFSLAAFVLVAVVHANTNGEAIVAKISALTPPKLDRDKIKDSAYVKSYIASQNEYYKQRNALILDLYKTDPDNPQTLKLLEERWERFNGASVAGKGSLLEDIASIRSTAKTQAIKDLADYEETAAKVRQSPEGEGKDKLIDAYLAKHPKDPHGQNLLLERAFQLPEDKRMPLFQKFLASYPDGKYAPMIKGAVRQREAVGKPFALSFNDAITGAKFDASALKGKVVLVDFWATWCGPCVAKMPEVKKWYTAYQPKGLEVVGVSLDNPEAQGGLKNLKEYVAKNAIPWPQYYQGNGWDSTYSSSWGIMSIPCTFLIDKKGNLREINPSDEETSIKKLLAE